MECFAALIRAAGEILSLTGLSRWRRNIDESDQVRWSRYFPPRTSGDREMSMKLADAAGSFTDINMTPLIDVMLVLLIIFIISLPPVTHAVKIDTPASGKPPPSLPAVVNLAIDFDGALSWNGRSVTRKTMQAYIADEAIQDPQPEVHISVDKFAKFARVVETLADLQSRGLSKIGFVNNVSL
jgi:biopolymer transport protein ExbD